MKSCWKMNIDGIVQSQVKIHTHVLANVLNLNSRSSASPSAANVHRPPFCFNSGASLASSDGASEPAENLGVKVLILGVVVMRRRVSG